MFQEPLSKEQKETSQELSKAWLANHQSGPYQMPPSGPFGSKGYWNTLRSVRLATDLEAGPTPKAGAMVDAELSKWGSARKEEGIGIQQCPLPALIPLHPSLRLE